MRLLATLLVLAGLVAATAATAQDDFVAEAGFLRVSIGGKPVRLEALTVKPAGATGRLPVALFAHGKTGTPEQMANQHAQDYIGQARDLASRGWLVVVAMRRGFGRSDGPLSANLSCASTSFLDRLEGDADDLTATLNAVAQRPDADPSRLIVIGESAGGAAATAFSARNPPGLMAVINISGGLQFEECPKEAELVAAFRAYGAKSRVASLWIYAKNDHSFRPDLVARMHAAFQEGGGNARLAMLEPDGPDGHAIFATATGRAQWLAEMDGQLRALKLPTWTATEASALMQKLRVTERARAFAEGYVAAPSQKALAREKGGNYLGKGFGGPTMEQARQSALEHCQQVKPACEIIMENDHWLAPEVKMAQPPAASVR